MLIPTRENYTEMTPIGFEQFVMMIFNKSIMGIPNAKIQHNEIIKTADGEYQIDGTIRFELMGVQYLTLVECKMYKSPISREKVQILYDKLRAIGAQKGILVTTSYFQSGAIDYASLHGIALIQIIDGKFTYSIRSKDMEIFDYPPDIPKFIGFAQYKISSGSIGCTDIFNTDYLVEFMTA